MALDMKPTQENRPLGSPAAPSDRGKDIAIVVIVVLVVLVVFAAIWFALSSLNTPSETATPTTTTKTDTVPEVKSDADLKKLEDEVRGTDIDDLDSELDANDTDAAGF